MSKKKDKVMSQSLVLGLSALTALIPLALIARRQKPQRDIAFWAAVLVSITGPSTWVIVQMSEAWQTGLSSALWVTVVASTVIFGFFAGFTRNGWQLASIFSPYMVILAGLALIWQQDTGQNMGQSKSILDFQSLDRWIQVHIMMSVVTYALVTLSGVASLGAFIQEKALRTKQPTTLSRLLPSLIDCEALTLRLLAIAVATLAIGLMTGMAMQFGETNQFLKFDHKTVLSLTSFGVILALLVAHFRSGLRGRLAARFVLLAYLLMTLGYPGVKLVTSVLLK